MRCNDFHMPANFAQALGTGKADAVIFDQVMALNGEVFRDVPGRRTLRFDLAGTSYFIKQHFGVGWDEIFKNLFSLRLPILSAMTEVRAIQKLNTLNIPTTPLVAYGTRGCSPARLESFVITEDLGDIVSLETFCMDWPNNPPDIKLKRGVIEAAARLARTLHDNGLNHRDFYICHFCLDKKRLAAGEIYLYLLDLHRVGIHKTLSTSARMKDMAALYFSAMDIGLTRRDYLRFLGAYRQDSIRNIALNEKDFWTKVKARAARLYLKFHGKMPANILSLRD
jgi:heptose I phosphotransferase